MQCQSFNSPLPDFPNSSEELSQVSALPGKVAGQLFHFQANFAGVMTMFGDAQTVAAYLDSHQNWFSECAQPMAVVPIANSGYLLTLGRFGALGWEMEVKVALALESSETGSYRMYSIPLTDTSSLPYKVDYQAVLELREIAPPDREAELCQLPTPITQVEWQLNLKIALQFPKFIQRLPASLVQKAGNGLLSQIVGQVSPRLTQRVQRDFHSRLELPPPPKNSTSYWQVNR